MMSPKTRAAGIALLALGVLAVFSGCGSDQKSPADPGIHSGKTTRNQIAERAAPVSPRHPPEPLFQKWPQPALAIVLSGEQNGYLEPCGCTEFQSGGVSRRADLFRQLREKGWPVTAFDLGNTVNRDRRQSQIKFEAIFAALKDMNYQVLALGPSDLRLGPDYLISQVPDSKFPESALPFVAANVTFTSGLSDLGPAATKIVTVGEIKVGVTGILGMSFAETIAPKGSRLAGKFSLEDPAAVLPAAIGELKKLEPDLLILLSHASLAESRKLAETFPEFDVILSAGGPEDPSDKPEYFEKQHTMLLTVGHKGKWVGVLGFFPDDSENRLRYELVELDQKRFQETPEMIEHMRFYQDRLREEAIVAVEPPIAHPSGARFVGSEACGDCHPKTYAKWKDTLHAHGFESLKPETPRAKKRLKGILRIYDAECLACHVTGWHPQLVLRYKSGFLNEEFAASDADRDLDKRLQGVGCENCHGPGSKHIELVDQENLAAAGKETRVTLEFAKNKLCYGCHDLDNSPRFEFDKYWKKIKHQGLD